MSPATSRCRFGRGCSAPVLFVVLPSGKRMPVDPQPAADGTVAVFRDATGAYVGRVLRDGEEPDAWERLHVTHFATCPAKAAADRQAKTDARIKAQAPNVAVLSEFRERRATRGRL